MDDPFDLARFVAAQDPVWPRVTAELAAGRKTTHWMWFVFPQIAGLGMSATSIHYALPSRAAAEAYLAHPVLGARLVSATRLMLGHEGLSAEAILGPIDAVKFRSCMTLFNEVAGRAPEFSKALNTFFDGAPDPLTLEKLG